MRLPTPDTGFRCGRYPAHWAPGRMVTTKAASFRFEIRAGSMVRNVNSPAEALRIARAHAACGGDVTVRDRSIRRGYLDEATLEHLTFLDTRESKMAEIVELAPGQAPPKDSDWVLVQVSKPGAVGTTGSVEVANGVIFWTPPAATEIDLAILNAQEWADERGVKNVYVQRSPRDA